MIELKFKVYNNSSSPSLNGLKVQIPKLCPVCAVAHNPIMLHKFSETINGSTTIAFVHTCSNCGKKSLTLNKLTKEDNKDYLEFIYCYPNSKAVSFDEKLEQLSPRFVSLYNQASFCEDNGYFDLAGMGYRAAMEILIKDYALGFELDTKEKIAQRNLNRSIEHYFKNDETSQIAADVVRMFGNDFAHWDRNEDYSLEQLKQYLEIFIQTINYKLMIKYPPVTRHKN
ncbi:DUF4145 domain-containing protein [Facklamia sp. P9177]|uniref:DUF4145 domain-containing protein n=1 Tax=Facklamia sp. P9177 TaxID=3421945 RepID=UPI003D17711D